MTDRVLLIEDDDAMRASLTQSMELEDITVLQANSLAQARRSLRANFPGVVLSDIRMPGGDGFDVLNRVREIDTDLPVIFLTGEADVPMAVRALQSGVYDFLEKPCSVEDLLRILRRALDHRRLVLQTRRLESTLEHSDAAALHFPGSSTASQYLRRELRALASLPTHVHIWGEPGAGRRLAAHTLHFLSEDDDPALTLNFATPGDAERLKAAHAVDRTTIILKNIEAAPPDATSHVSAALDLARSPRIIATSERPQNELPQWEAILPQTAELRVPSLRARHTDLPLIFENLVRQTARSLDTDMPDIPGAIFDRIVSGDWSGNLPQLRQEARALVLNNGHVPDEAAPGLADQLAAFEKSLLISALRQNDGVATRAAEQLKLPRKTFYDKLARHGIEPKTLKPGDGDTGQKLV